MRNFTAQNKVEKERGRQKGRCWALHCRKKVPKAGTTNGEILSVGLGCSRTKTDDMTALRTELPEGVVRENKKGKRRGAEGGGTEVWRTSGNEGGWQLNRSETNRKECGTFA